MGCQSYRLSLPVATRPRTPAVVILESGSRAISRSDTGSAIEAGSSWRSSQAEAPRRRISATDAGVGPNIARRSRCSSGSAGRKPDAVTTYEVGRDAALPRAFVPTLPNRTLDTGRVAQRKRSERLVETVASGVAELRPDPDRDTAFTLLLDGAPQSHVDLADPTHLQFEYVRRMAAAIDLLAPPRQPVRALHLGGGALTIPRYVAATRPGSAQRVIEIDGPLVEFVRRVLPLPAKASIRVRIEDARAAVEGMRDAGYDVIVLDVFAGARTPAHLTSVEFLREVARVLAPTGHLIANVTDGPPLRHAKTQVATIRAVLPEACLIADSTVLRGRRYGNLVVIAGRTPPPLAGLARRAAGDWFPGRLETDLDRFAGGAAPVTDSGAVASPLPPAGLFGNRT